MKRIKKMFTKQWFIDEAISVGTTMGFFLLADAGGLLLQVYNGDLSEPVLYQLSVAFGRSALKTLLSLVFPKVFPVRSSNAKKTEETSEGEVSEV